MPRYSFQVRTGDDTIGHGAALEFDDLAQALTVAEITMTGKSMRDAGATMDLAGSALEIIDEAGAVVASLPIGGTISRH